MPRTKASPVAEEVSATFLRCRWSAKRRMWLVQYIDDHGQWVTLAGLESKHEAEDFMELQCKAMFQWYLWNKEVNNGVS